VEYHFWLYWFQLPFIISAGKWEGQMIVDASLGFLNNVPLLTKNNIDTIGRYFCQDQTEEKFLKPDEARQIAQANIRLFTIFEQAVDLTSGVAHANCALDCAKAIGQPAQSAIYFGIEKNGGFTEWRVHASGHGANNDVFYGHQKDNRWQIQDRNLQ
jgi:hypothetical protein